jgi:tetratricopeptide (TPR) repeat protein
MFFAHGGFRALWPAIFFLPWFSVGIAYLLEGLLHRRSRSLALLLKKRSVDTTHGSDSRFISANVGVLRIVGLGLLLTAAPLALADATPEERAGCPVASQEQSRNLGELLFEQGDYQRAGECYQAAGEYTLANRAFLRAVGPESAATARQLSDQRDQAKTMLHKVQQAFRGAH